ncbi:hypothetical protein BC628DRAFT_31961 [Trametes gibbosa]|nr:hypothetical protein BC628DRAFT_31961 [Trametes gibbosa]
MTRFCFSTSASISMYESDVKIHQGPWAGDRICITTIERAITPDPAYPWKDVTDEVIADIVTLYKANWGADWETEIKKFHGPFDYHWFSGDRGDGVDDHVPTQWQREYYRMHMQVA